MTNALNHLPIRESIQTFLTTALAVNGTTIITPIQVTREDLTETPDRTRGYVVWDYDTTLIEMCSGQYTQVVYGDLDLVVYASWASRNNQKAILDVLLDTVAPSGNELGEDQWDQVYLHYLRIIDIDELYVEKTGKSIPETVGTQIQCRVKFSL